MRWMVAIALFATSIQAQTLRRYSDPEFPFSFWYPAGWDVRTEDGRLVLTPANYEQIMRVNDVDVYR